MISTIHPFTIRPLAPLTNSPLHLVSNADKVIRQLLGNLRSLAGLDGLGVVRNEDGLLGSDTDNTLLTLNQTDMSAISNDMKLKCVCSHTCLP